MRKNILILAVLLSVFGCTSTGVKYAKYNDKDFKREKYLGKWYEIARKDHWFEKGLNNVTAEYSLKKNGDIEVKNSGYSTKKQKREVAIGNAKISKNIGNILKVSFFGPFYADYIILDYDRENYTYALVRSKKPEYLWILSRSPTIEPEILKGLLKKAEDDGLTVNDLIYVEQKKD